MFGIINNKINDLLENIGIVLDITEAQFETVKSRYDAVAKQLSKDQYIKFIAKMFYETSLVMYNIDVCTKYLEGELQITLWKYFQH